MLVPSGRRLHVVSCGKQHRHWGIAGNAWTWDLASAALDAGVAGDRVTVEIEAEREGLASWQAQVRTVERAGYGLLWGQHWGGVSP